MKCLIVEDEPMARRLLEQYVAKVPDLELAGALSNGLAALAFLKTNEVDVLFLDVQMPELTGVDLLRILKRRPAVILTTAYSEYAVESYALDVADYLLKPITFERFLAAVERISERVRKSGNVASTVAIPNAPASEVAAAEADYLFVKDGQTSVRLALADVQYIEGMKDYVRIHTPHRKITSLQSMRNLMEVLPAGEFLRIHNSTIIGVRWLEEVHRDEVRVASAMLTVSDKYRAEVRAFVAGRELR